MPRVTITTDPPMDRFRRRFDAHRLIDEPMREGFKEFGDKMRRRADDYSKPHAGDRGTIGDSLEIDLAGSGWDLEERLFTRNEVAEEVEEGRRPGASRRPSSTVIAAYLARHGNPGGPRMGFVVARRIYQRGTRGIHFLRRAANDSAKADGQGVFSKVAQRIAENWRRG